MEGKKLYLIGIDAAPLWILDRLSSMKGMGGFDLFRERGLLAPLESVLPPMTGPSWPTMYTGLDPGESGIPDFFYLDRDYTKQLAYFDQKKTPPFWDVLSGKGMKSLVITPAMVVRPDAGRDVDLMTGWPLPPKFSSKRVKEAAKMAGFEGEPQIEGKMKSGEIKMAEASRIYSESIRQRAEMAKSMMEGKGYDMAFICFTETDRVQHYTLNSDWERHLYPLYREISSFISWVGKYAADRGGDYAVMLVSDHGAQPIREKFLLNSWMINKGYASLASPGTSHPGTAVAEKTAAEKSRALYAIRERLISSGRLRGIYDKMPHRVKHAVRSAVRKVSSPPLSGDFTRIHDFDLDMRNTSAFASVSNLVVGTIWINDRRFSKATVPLSSKKALKAKLTGELKRIRTREGKRLVKNVFDGDDYYKGTKLFIAPDLLVEAEEGYTMDIFNYSKTSDFMPPELAKSGDHTRYGVFGIFGKGVGLKPFERAEMNVRNIGPTALRYLGVAPSRKAVPRSIL